MKITLFAFFILTYAFNGCFSQDSLFKPYQVDADAKMQINKAVEEANSSNKHVLIMVGGNWCKWCIMLTKFLAENESLDSIVKADYIYIHVNFSKENKNEVVLKQLEYPERFGFPVLVILDEKGKRIHTQNSAYLEEEKSYSKELLKDFLLSWNYSALHPITE